MSKFNYFKIITVNTSSFPVDPQVSFAFNSQGIILYNRGTSVVEYSFDGVNVHGDLDPTDSTAGISFDHRVECKIFFRTAGASQTVRVEAWG